MSKAFFDPNTRSNRCTTVVLTLALAFVFCGGPQLLAAQQAPATAAQQPQPDPQAQPAQPAGQPTENAQQPAEQSAQPSQDDTQNPASQSEAAGKQRQTARPGMVDPSQGPLTPAPSSNPDMTPVVQPQDLPDAPSATQAPPETPQQTPEQKPRPRTTQPVGVGTAQQAPTAGGAASKPAGAAIAPAKQKQYRSLLIKIGAIAAGGAALGTVYALSRGTKSTPPGAGR